VLWRLWVEKRQAFSNGLIAFALGAAGRIPAECQQNPICLSEEMEVELMVDSFVCNGLLTEVMSVQVRAEEANTVICQGNSVGFGLTNVTLNSLNRAITNVGTGYKDDL
jgi:hypothetical protein